MMDEKSNSLSLRNLTTKVRETSMESYNGYRPIHSSFTTRETIIGLRVRP